MPKLTIAEIQTMMEAARRDCPHTEVNSHGFCVLCGADTAVIAEQKPKGNSRAGEEKHDTFTVLNPGTENAVAYMHRYFNARETTYRDVENELMVMYGHARMLFGGPVSAVFEIGEGEKRRELGINFSKRIALRTIRECQAVGDGYAVVEPDGAPKGWDKVEA